MIAHIKSKFKIKLENCLIPKLKKKILTLMEEVLAKHQTRIF